MREQEPKTRPARRAIKRLMVRVDAETSDRFESLSLKEHVPVNILYEKALRRYVEWDVFAEKVGLVQISLSLWEFLMNRLGDAEVRELGRRSGGDASVEFIRSYFHRFDLDTALESFRLLGDQYMHIFKYTDFGDSSHRTVVLHHKAGLRVAAYYAEVLRALCEKLGIQVGIKESEDQIVVTIDNQSLQRKSSGTADRKIVSASDE